ncbi:hypothetical protein SAMN05428949_4658 [Chitinophaga sp. YR627]|nr:hypothetical protein SAMN05428949_4658 [Chitinophaga sp. YR627]
MSRKRFLIFWRYKKGFTDGEPFFIAVVFSCWLGLEIGDRVLAEESSFHGGVFGVVAKAFLVIFIHKEFCIMPYFNILIRTFFSDTIQILYYFK